VSCTDGTSATVHDGALGPPGQTGPPGPPGPSGDVAVEQLEAEVERNRAAMCAKADFDGDSYRPFVCDPRCGCLEPDFLAELVSCSETSPGTFVASQSGPPSSCVVPAPSNFCGAIPYATGQAIAFVDACGSSSQRSCAESSDCSNGEFCSNSNGFDGICHIPCSSTADCAQPPPRCETSIQCNFAIPCPSGWTCSSLLGGGSCRKSGCTSDADCVVPGRGVTLAGVGPADSPAAADCSVSDELGRVVTTPINSNDAFFCIAQIEAVTGECQ
jgi:hypothetical protein